MDIIIAIAIGLAGLAYAVHSGIKARRPNQDARTAAKIRRARERTLKGWQILTSLVFVATLALLFLGEFLSAAVMSIGGISGLITVVYVRSLLRS